ncbi:carbohydrate ABC transporter permease [Candidatus Bipolaricaulota bacterium]|nr:carbohydrate ABC transporter permease [Candidatus Bipolaricaulota bacterium]
MSEKATRVMILIGYALFSLLPLYWLASVSFQQEFNFPPKPLPTDPTLSHYTTLFSKPSLVVSIINSILIGIMTAILSVLISSMAAYAFGKLKFAGKKIVFLGVILTFLLPPNLNIVPLYSLFAEMGLLDNRFALIFLYQILILPLNIFLFINYFDTIKESIVESAIVDGAGPIRRFYRIFLPLSKPAIVAGFIFGFRFSWGEYIFAQTFIRSRAQMLFPATLQQAVYGGQYTVNYDLMAAGAMVLLVPTLAVLIFGQDYLEIGLQLGGVD